MRRHSGTAARRHGALSPAVPLCLCAALFGCGTNLPKGTTEFTVGHTVVRTDSVLDMVGLVWRLSDTNQVPPRGPVRRWYQSLQTRLDDPAFATARAAGPIPISILLETWADPTGADTVCGYVAPDERRCFTGNAPMRRQVGDLIAAARSFGPRVAGVELDGINDAGRRRDLADVYVALTTGKSLDSAVGAYSGYADLAFDVTLARTGATISTTPTIDPARPTGPAHRIFLAPDQVFPERSYRSPNYVWLALSHQMAHAVLRRVFDERPDLLRHGWTLRPAVEGEMVHVGYTSIFWDDALGEQLARALTIRILGLTSPTLTWAARAEALNTGMALVPWLEDQLTIYEQHRDQYPTLAAFVPRLAAALDSIPTDPCRAAPSPGVALVGVAKHRAVVGWIAPDSPFRPGGLQVGDTVVSVAEDSVSAGGLLLPSRQLEYKWAQHLPYELSYLGIVRHGRVYAINAPVMWGRRQQVRIASQARTAVAVPAGTPVDSLPICRWVTRARRR
jgi:hypothetical protein